jgi:hypothetical protein
MAGLIDVSILTYLSIESKIDSKRQDQLHTCESESVQYTSEQVRRVITGNGSTCSMSPSGHVCEQRGDGELLLLAQNRVPYGRGLQDKG